MVCAQHSLQLTAYSSSPISSSRAQHSLQLTVVDLFLLYLWLCVLLVGVGDRATQRASGMQQNEHKLLGFRILPSVGS